MRREPRRSKNGVQEFAEGAQDAQLQQIIQPAPEAQLNAPAHIEGMPRKRVVYQRALSLWSVMDSGNQIVEAHIAGAGIVMFGRAGHGCVTQSRRTRTRICETKPSSWTMCLQMDMESLADASR